MGPIRGRWTRWLQALAGPDPGATLAVEDAGPGVRPQDRPRVFDRFWRADPARTQGGTGLGLPISREDAALHGGSLQAWGRPGEGSEFVLTLPRTVPSAGEQDGGGGPAPLIRPVFA